LQQIGNIWNNLEPRKRIIVALASIAVFSAVLMLARMASTPTMSLLYSGLESGPAGEVVAALEQRGVTYEVRGGAILVDASQRDTLRMTLAGEGLPANSSKGYELLDGLSGFGTTSQMFDAAYWRAKEGELARTIVSHPAISSARVHIANSGSNPFQRNMRPSASVMINSTSGEISNKQARALKYLVASAISGMSPDDVTIVDSNGGLIGGAEESTSNVPNDRAETMRQRIERLLEARVGRGNAVVEVSVDTVTKSESVRERRIDPQSRVAISTESEERSDKATDQGSDVTVASNLPDGDAAGETSSSQSSETRERVNYEVSETEREVTVAPGAIKRLTVAVLVNGITATNDSGETSFQPRSNDELASLQELVASAIGFDESRGDVITIKTMEFQPVKPLGTEAESSLLEQFPFDLMSMIQTAVLGVVAIILGLFVVRPLLAKPPTPLQANNSALPDIRLAEGPSNLEALTGEIDDGTVNPSEMSFIPEQPQNLGFDTPGLPALSTAEENPVERLRALIGERQEETVEILRNWLDGEEEAV
jgi:flagellar M-ring protein FliF